MFEINPVFKTSDDLILAADSKVNLEDNALFRHRNYAEMRDLAEEDPKSFATSIVFTMGKNYKKDKDGVVVIDYLLENTDPKYVNFQMDLYWVTKAGADPVAYFKKYPNRFKLCHVKDLVKIPSGHESCVIGKGTIDFKNILNLGAQKGLQYFIVEQEAYTGTNELDCAKDNATAMSQLNWK